MILLSTSDPHLPIFLLTSAVSLALASKTSEKKDYRSSPSPIICSEVWPKTSLLDSRPRLPLSLILFLASTSFARLLFAAEFRNSSRLQTSRVRSFQFLYVVIISQNSEVLFVLVPFPKGRENLGLVLAFQIFPFYAGTLCPHVFRFEFYFFL